jgi:hypothetical protein
VDAVSGIITTLAASSSFTQPRSIAVDAFGNLYVSDAEANVVRKIAGGAVSIIAGTGVAGFSGDGGPATAAQISMPAGVAVDSGGNVFFGDYNNRRVRRIDAVTGIISTFVGPDAPDYLGYPNGVAVDSAGNLLINDSAFDQVLRVSAATGNVTVVAGDSVCSYSCQSGPAAGAGFFSASVAVDAAGNLILPDELNNLVRFVDLSSPQVSLAPAGLSVGSAAGTGNVAVTVTAGGPYWRSTSPTSWLTLTSASGSGNGTIAYSFTANTSFLPRTAVIVIYGQSFTVTQAAASTAALSLASTSVSAAAGTGTVTLTLTPAVPWTASSSASWLTVSPASGGAGGTLTYSFGANTGSGSRTATLVIAKKTFSVTQVGSTGNYTAWEECAT